MAPIFFYCNMEDSDLLSASVVPEDQTMISPQKAWAQQCIVKCTKMQCKMHK